MIYRLLVEGVLAVHFAFVLFAVFGGIGVFYRRAVAWIHVPAVMWATLIECAGWICPLTPLENLLRAKGGLSGYETGFIEHYVMPLLYPAALTRNLQIMLGTVVIGINLLVYGLFVLRFLKKKHRRPKNHL